jgi:hypothetical protein
VHRSSRSENEDSLSAVLTQVKKSRDLISKRKNSKFLFTLIVALLARLEIAKNKNFNLKKKYDRFEENKLQRQLAELRFKDFRRAKPPPLVPLPIKQVPGKQYAHYNLKGQVNLSIFFEKFSEEVEIENKKMTNREEPRYFTKLINKSASSKKQSNSILPEADNETLLSKLELRPFNRFENVKQEISGKPSSDH